MKISTLKPHSNKLSFIECNVYLKRIGNANIAEFVTHRFTCVKRHVVRFPVANQHSMYFNLCAFYLLWVSPSRKKKSKQDSLVCTTGLEFSHKRSRRLVAGNNLRTAASIKLFSYVLFSFFLSIYLLFVHACMLKIKLTVWIAAALCLTHVCLCFMWHAT